jgi:hypothetical protein
MVTEQDLIDTVAAAYAAGWRQVKLYFMCGLPTETDEDVLQIADARQAGHRDRAPGQRSPGHPVHRVHRRVRAQAAHPVPVGGAARRRGRPTPGYARLRDTIRADRRYGRLHRLPLPRRPAGHRRGLLSRGDRRVGRVIEAVWRDGGRFDGWSEHFSYERWMAGRRARLFAGTAVSVDWYTTREREEIRVLPWDHIDSGLDREWLWDDWQDALAETRSRTAGGAPASTAGSARRWAPRSRWARPAAVCSRCRSSVPTGNGCSKPPRDARVLTAGVCRPAGSPRRPRRCRVLSSPLGDRGATRRGRAG